MTSNLLYLLLTWKLKLRHWTMVRLWGLFTLTRRRNILATYLSYIRRNVNQYSITTTYDLIIEWHENANLDIKHKSQIPITNYTYCIWCNIFSLNKGYYNSYDFVWKCSVKMSFEIIDNIRTIGYVKRKFENKCIY